MKICIECTLELDEDKFDWNRSGLTRKSKCSQCVAKSQREATARYRAKARGPNWKPKVTIMLPCSSAGHKCKSCAVDKDCSEFYKNETFSNGHEGECKTCKDARRKARFVQHREQLDSGLALSRFRKDQATALIRNFNITTDQYEYLASLQNQLCALCEEPERRVSGHSGRIMNLAVDHDRRCCPSTKSCGNCVRGLLCSDCNTSLGKLECKPVLVEKFNLGQYINNRPLEKYAGKNQ